MARISITRKLLDVPSDAMFSIAEIIADNEITHTIKGVDEEDGDTIHLEVEYSRDERDAIRDIENIIEDYEEEDSE